MQTLIAPSSYSLRQDSQDSQFSERDDAYLQGEKLFAETIAAHGGEDFLNLQTLKITGKGEFTTPPQTGGLKVPLAAFTLYIATGGRSRLEARSPGGPVHFVSRGYDKGGFVVLAGRTLQLTGEQANDIEPLEFLRRAVQQKFPIAAVLNDTPEIAPDGKTLLCYNVHRSQGNSIRVFVESDTKLVRKTVTETTRGEMTVLLSHYQTVSGLPIFGELHLLENGSNVLKLMAAEITLDEPLKDALFERA